MADQQAKSAVVLHMSKSITSTQNTIKTNLSLSRALFLSLSLWHTHTHTHEERYILFVSNICTTAGKIALSKAICLLLDFTSY